MPGARNGGGETLIYVDVDGVLNIGLRDEGNTPLLFSDSNVAAALRPRTPAQIARGGAELQCLEKLTAVYNRKLSDAGDDSTYAELAAASGTQVSDVLVGRLAKIIQAAGKNRKVILSSTWRLPRHSSRAAALEEAIGKHLAQRFKFDLRTRICRETSASDRLKVIGEHVAEYCAARGGARGPVKVLVLEDFCITPLNGWAVDGKAMLGSASIERYLESRAGRGTATSTKLVHMYDEWTMEGGLGVQIGAGLTPRHLREALDFLSQDEILKYTDDPHASVEIAQGLPNKGKAEAVAAAAVVCPLISKTGLLGVFSQLLNSPTTTAEL